MGLNLSGKTIFIDTAPIVYFIEERPIFLDKVSRFPTNDAEFIKIHEIEILFLSQDF